MTRPDRLEEPVLILLENIAIKAAVGADLSDNFVVADLASGDRDRVTRTEPCDREGRERDDQQDDRQPEQATDDVRTHGSSLSCGRFRLAVDFDESETRNHHRRFKPTGDRFVHHDV